MKTKKFLPILVLVIFFSLAFALTVAGAADSGDRSVEKTIKAGKTYDIFSGNCGLYFTNAPEDGELKLARTDRHALSLRFMKDPCTVEYENEAGNLVRSFNGILIAYFILDDFQVSKWHEGDLAFYVHDGGWKECPAVLNGNRLSCWPGTFDNFGIVDLPEPDEEDEDKKSAKAPSGEKVAVGQTLDLYAGICGMWVSNLPSNGYADMDRVEKNKYSMKFIKDVCEFTFEDSQENELSMAGTYMIGYVNLNRAQAAAWGAGDLGFYANYGSGWSELPAMLVYENGSPRLCATMTGPAMFGIVDLFEEEEEEDD